MLFRRWYARRDGINQKEKKKKPAKFPSSSLFSFIFKRKRNTLAGRRSFSQRLGSLPVVGEPIFIVYS